LTGSNITDLGIDAHLHFYPADVISPWIEPESGFDRELCPHEAHEVLGASDRILDCLQVPTPRSSERCCPPTRDGTAVKSCTRVVTREWSVLHATVEQTGDEEALTSDEDDDDWYDDDQACERDLRLEYRQV
jgi:hypothetical protein